MNMPISPGCSLWPHHQRPKNWPRFTPASRKRRSQLVFSTWRTGRSTHLSVFSYWPPLRRDWSASLTEREGPDAVLGELATRVSPRILEAPRRLDVTARQLEEYFARRRRRFDLPLDMSLSSGFRRTVLTYLSNIAYGQTASYGAVAAAVDNPKAVRAVGSACATNPLPLIIPCHRVIRSDGVTGAYRAQRRGQTPTDQPGGRVMSPAKSPRHCRQFPPRQRHQLGIPPSR